MKKRLFSILFLLFFSYILTGCGSDAASVTPRPPENGEGSKYDEGKFGSAKFG